jgi:glucosamine-6-phosphate deaminase
MSMVDSFEKVTLNIFPDLKQGSVSVAKEIAKLIRAKQARKEKCVLGLATGSTPKTLYAELVRLHKQDGLSFQNVIAFNLDEYYPIDKDALQSYARFMKVNLFDHVDILPENCHIPNGELPKEEIRKHCAEYEQKIEEVGGIDLQILGIGNNDI